MLTKHKALEGKIVRAWTERAYREVEHEAPAAPTYEPAENVRLVIDESADILGAVSDQYTLVQNAELLSAVDVVVEQHGLSVEPAIKGNYYKNGRSQYTLVMPGRGFKIGRDPSESNPTIVLNNDYRGSGGLRVSSGLFRLVCTNGLVMGRILYRDNQRHVGKIDLMEFVNRAIVKAVDEIEVIRVMAESMADAPLTTTHRQVNAEGVERNLRSADLIRETLAPRYHNDFDRAVRENVAAIGDNQWAIIQAVAEMATHRMQTRANGQPRDGHNVAADEWAARMVAVVSENYVEVGA